MMIQDCYGDAVKVVMVMFQDCNGDDSGLLW